MRKTSFAIFTLLFITACLPLFSQLRQGSKIYVAPVSGYGSVKDNEFFHGQVSYEVVLQYHEAVLSKRGSQYTFKGLIEPYTGEVSTAAAAVHIPDKTHPVPPRPVPRVRNSSDRREFFSWEVDGNILFYDTSEDVNLLPSSKEPMPEKFNPDDLEFIFYLALVNNKTDVSIGEQYLIYKTTDTSVSRIVSIMVENLLSLIPVNMERIASNDFRDKWLFLDACVLWAPRLYSGKSDSISWLNFGAAITAEFHFIDFLSLSTGIQLTQDWVVVNSGEEYQDLILEIPFTIRYVIKSGSSLMIEPYTGVFSNISLLNKTNPSSFSWLIGCQIGIDMGPGMLVIDPRFALDFFESNLKSSMNSLIEYRRYLLQFGIGYKFGFFQK